MSAARVTLIGVGFKMKFFLAQDLCSIKDSQEVQIYKFSSESWWFFLSDISVSHSYCLISIKGLTYTCV